MAEVEPSVNLLDVDNVEINLSGASGATSPQSADLLNGLAELNINDAVNGNDTVLQNGMNGDGGGDVHMVDTSVMVDR